MAKGKVLQTVVDISGEISPTLGKTIDGVSKKLSGISGTALAVGGAVGGIAVATGKAVLKAADYLVDLGKSFDSAYDAIRIGTGATGEALDALKGDMEAVYSSVPTTMEDAGQAIADFNTRLGLTGDELQGLSVQAIQVSDMLGEDLGKVIEGSSQAFQQWGIDSEDMADSMDYVFKVSQSTGMGFSSLMTNMQTFGPQLQDIGYSFEEAAALMGQLEKAGVNTEEVLAAMKKSVGVLAKQGIDAGVGLETFSEHIKNAKTEAEAAAIASELFGAKAGSSMAAAIRNGSLSVSDLTSQLEASQETISGAAEDTYDYAEKMQMFKQKAEVALAPMANTLFDGLNGVMDVAGSFLEKLMPLIQNVVEQAQPFVEEFLSGLIEALEEIVPVLLDVTSAILPILIDFIKQLLPPLLDMIKKLLPPLMQIVQMLLPVIAEILAKILPIVTEIISAILPVIVEILAELLPILMPILDIFISLLNDVVLPLLDPLLSLITAILPAIEPILRVVLESLKPVFDLLKLLAPILADIIGFIAQVVGWVAQGLNWVVNLIFGDSSGDVAEAAKVNGYATGGITNGLSIAGEDPRYPNEYIISLNPAYRSQNLAYWAEAGRMLNAGYSDFALGGASGGVTIDMGGITFAPNITVTGHADKGTIMAAIEEEYPEFLDMIEEYLVERGALVYA